jgi:cellobiose-specific phosphotransferase system component IIC
MPPWPHTIAPPKPGPITKTLKTPKTEDEPVVIKNERHTMHLLLMPVLASALYIGGGGVGLVLIIVVVVLLLR